MNRLITIPISHFCEKARWVLELGQIPYREEAHLQVFHYLPALLAGGSYMVPVLTTDDGPVTGSSDIVGWADRHSRAAEPLNLYPEDIKDEVVELERGFDDVLGPHSRLWMYQQLLGTPEIAAKYGVTGIPCWQKALVGPAFPLVARFIRTRFSIDDEQAQRSLKLAESQMDLAAERLQKATNGSGTGTFLCGDRFTAADLSFACMAVPLLMPAKYGVPLPPLDELPSRCRVTIERLRAHPAGEYAMRLFRERRPSRKAAT